MRAASFERTGEVSLSTGYSSHAVPAATLGGFRIRSLEAVSRSGAGCGGVPPD